MSEILWVFAIGILIIAVYIILLFLRILIAQNKSFREIDSIAPNINTTVIVMGASVYVDGPSPELKARLNTAIYIYELIKPQRFYLYGGEGIVNEAESMKNYLIDAGLPENLIEADSLGRNTRVSFERFAAKNVPGEIDQLVAVSSGYHSFRMIRQAKKFGFNLKAVSAQNSPENQNKDVRNLRLISELIAVLWYKVPISISRHVDTGPQSFRHRIPKFFIARIRNKRVSNQNPASVG